MTPSEAHDSARNRDAGHDEMQAELWRYLKGESLPPIIVKKDKDPDLRYERKEVEIEYPFVVDGKIIGFADVCETWSSLEKDKYGHDGRIHRLFRIFEVKPKIWSIGAVIRQATALRHIAWRLKDHERQSPRVSVILVVPFDDPKLSLLRELSSDRVWAWGKDGAPI